MQYCFKQKGKSYQHSCIYTPQQNGVVECKHRHILESTRALHFQTHPPLHFLAKYVLTAMHIINRSLTPLLSQQTPFESLYGKIHSYSHLKIFGCLAYATNMHIFHKLALQAERCIFLDLQVGKKLTNLMTPQLIKCSLFMMSFFMKIFFPMSPLHLTHLPPKIQEMSFLLLCMILCLQYLFPQSSKHHL